MTQDMSDNPSISISRFDMHMMRYDGRFNPSSPHLIFLETKGFRMKISMKLVY